MKITYGDGAADAFRTAVAKIPAGYVVALLRDTEDAPYAPEPVPGVDVSVVATTPDGVAYRDIDRDARPVGAVKILTWEELAHVHVY